MSVSAVQRETKKSLPLTVEPVPADMSWLSQAPKDHEEVITVHLSILIAVDLSGSMSGSPLREAQKAAKKFVTEIDLSHASLGLMVFADKVQITQDICQNARKLNKGIDHWSHLMQTGAVGWGNDTDPFANALKILKKRDDPRFIIVLTDGVWYRQDDAIQRAKKCHQEGIEIIAIGFGGADRRFLKAIATSDESALFTDLSKLVVSFSKIARVLTEAGGEFGDATNKGNKKKGFLNFFSKG